jgi:hypothetical protein
MLTTVQKEIVAAYFKAHLGEIEIYHVNSIRTAGRTEFNSSFGYKISNYV